MAFGVLFGDVQPGIPRLGDSPTQRHLIDDLGLPSELGRPLQDGRGFVGPDHVLIIESVLRGA